MKHNKLSKLANEFKDSINELLRETDIGRPSGIQVPPLVMINLDSAYKIYQMLEKLSDIDDIVGESNLHCPVESQNVVSAIRVISESKEIKEQEMDFLK